MDDSNLVLTEELGILIDPESFWSHVFVSKLRRFTGELNITPTELKMTEWKTV